MNSIVDFLQSLTQWWEGLAILVAVSGWSAARLRRVRRGSPENSYRRWFLEKYSTYWNPYLEEREPLHLDRTYVPLFASEGSGSRATDRAKVVGTTAVIADRTGHVIILGDAGSGKTTTLKAYGVSLLSRTDNGRGERPEIPFFVPARMLAAMPQRDALARYLIVEILGVKVGMSRPDAEEFLADLLHKRRCLVLLDGLDEVTPTDYQAVRDEVYRFTDDSRASLPTRNARLVITCRRQNFLRISDDWRHAENRFGAHQTYVLAPMRDTEIMNYLDKFRSRFASPDGPERFMTALRASDPAGPDGYAAETLLRLHRNPLVLSMSISLYAHRQALRLPRSAAKLYELMIREMLDRHSFLDSEERRRGVNMFLTQDKLRVLREFGYQAARGAHGFGSFRRDDLVEHVRECWHLLRLDGGGTVEELVAEIIDRSGLLSHADGDAYEFAHRSIQEYLVAAELLSRPDGADLLCERADRRDWRQVVIFYTAMAEQRTVTPLLRRLAGIDPVLACACLAAADCEDPDALAILAQTIGAAETRPSALSAVFGAVASPRPRVRAAARQLIPGVLDRIADEKNPVNALGGTLDGILDVVAALIERREEASAQADLITRLVKLIPDDPRIVGLLWRCLATADDDAPAAGDVLVNACVIGLLEAAMDQACFDELQRQPVQQPAFATVELRRRAYPFRSGVGLASNLVTLLCWAEHRGIIVEKPNRFLAAKYQAPGEWARIEQDRSPADSLALPIIRVRLAARSRAERILGACSTALAGLVLTGAIVDLLLPGGLAAGQDLIVIALAVVDLVPSVAMLGVRVRVTLRPAALFQANRWVEAYEDPRSRHWLVGGPAGLPAVAEQRSARDVRLDAGR